MQLLIPAVSASKDEVPLSLLPIEKPLLIHAWLPAPEKEAVSRTSFCGGTERDVLKSVR
jgi:hypothetical protein